MIPFEPPGGQQEPNASTTPPPAPLAGPGQPIPMTEQQMGVWKGRIDRARRKRDLYLAEWQTNLDAYNGTPLKNQPTRDWVNPNTDFADVEQKKSTLFFTTPEIHCTAKEPLAQGMEHVVLLKQAVLNDKLGPNGVNAKRLMDKVLFDALCPSGWGATKIGYDATTRPVDQPDPNTGQSTSVDVTVYEEWYWEHISPRKLLVPEDFFDNEFDKSPWIGMDIALPRLTAIRKYNLPDDFRSISSSDPAVFDQPQGVTDTSRDLVTGVEIWYKAALEDESVFHPEMQRVLVLIDGLDDAPARHIDSPNQSLDQMGRLTPDSMVGYPIHVLTLRDLTDSAYIRSDCSMIRDLNDQFGKFLTTQVKQRETSIPMRIADQSIVTPDVMTKITEGDYGSIIPMMSINPPPIIEIARAQYPRESNAAAERFERQIAKTLALDSNQQGVKGDTERTATELTIVANNASVRMKAERNRAINFFLRGVEKFDSLLQRFATETTAIQILGPQGQQEWSTWNKDTIAGRFGYTIKPDSGLDLDEATVRKQALDTYNFLGKDPLVDRSYLIQELAPALHLDPIKIKAPPPPPQVDKPSISIAFKGEDLVNPLAVAMLIQGGVDITPEIISKAISLIADAVVAPAVPQATGADQPAGATGASLPPPAPSPPHPGATPKTELIDQHTADHTGAISGAPNLPQKFRVQ